MQKGLPVWRLARPNKQPGGLRRRPSFPEAFQWRHPGSAALTAVAQWEGLGAPAAAVRHLQLGWRGQGQRNSSTPRSMPAAQAVVHGCCWHQHWCTHRLLVTQIGWHGHEVHNLQGRHEGTKCKCRPVSNEGWGAQFDHAGARGPQQMLLARGATMHVIRALYLVHILLDIGVDSCGSAGTWMQPS